MKSNSFMRNRKAFTTVLLFCTGFIASHPLVVSAADKVMAVQLIHQQQTIKGIVVDASGEPVIGANVVVEGTTMGTITDFEGTFSISVPKNGKIKISFIGYKDQVLTPQSGKNLRVVLEDDSQMLGEVQVVAYGAQKKVSITGAISSMKGEDLLKTPAASMSNVLSGQITGISSVQYSGEPGADEADLYVRGIATWNNAKPLIQVDGVEREFSQIDPNEVESITVLKDASATAVFGVRGANGVILITTKRGAEGKAKISFSTSAGVNLRTKQLEFANSYQYASYYNDLQVNDGGVPTFTEEQLIKFRDHTDPILYPDINWIDYCMNKAAFQSQHNVNISGGTDRMRYFVSAGMFTQDGMFKQLAASDNFNFNYKRYNYRANLDFDATKTTLISVNIGGRIETKRTPESGEDQNQLFRKLYWAVPFAGAGIVDGKRVVSNADYLPFTGSDGLNSYYGKGFRSTTTNVLNVDLVLDQKLDFITKGLSFKLKGSYNTSYWTQKIASSSMAVYTPVLHDDGSIGYRKSGSDSQLSYSRNSNGEGKSRDWYMEAALNYSRKFGDHNVTGLVLYNQSKRYYPGGTYDDIPSAYVGFVGRATYDYKTRYMAEFNVGYNGSENFAPGKRYGLFPAGSIGWIVSEESFFKPLKKVINYFKVRASVGMVGNDNNGNNRFLYLPDAYILNDDGYFFGTNAGNKKPGAYEASKSNADVTWEKSVKQNYGIDLKMFDSRLSFTADIFFEKRKDILSTRNTLPTITDIQLPKINLGKVNNHGYELSLGWNDRAGKVNYWVKANMSYAKNKIIYMDEVVPNEPYMAETGRSTGLNYGYLFDRFLQKDDFDADGKLKVDANGEQILPKMSLGTPRPGDTLFKDLNGDGVIDGDDKTYFGYARHPEYVFGFLGGFSWKNFEFSMQWTAAMNASRILEGEYRNAFGSTNSRMLLKFLADGRWTEENPCSRFPRLTFMNKTHYLEDTDLWLMNGSYLRLKTAEISYTFQNKDFLKKIGVESVRLYCNGYNLLTLFSDLNDIDIDPEGQHLSECEDL